MSLLPRLVGYEAQVMSFQLTSDADWRRKTENVALCLASALSHQQHAASFLQLPS